MTWHDAEDIANFSKAYSFKFSVSMCIPAIWLDYLKLAGIIFGGMIMLVW